MKKIDSQLIIEPGALELMVNDAEDSHPNECCGFFFGNEDGNVRNIMRSTIAQNSKEGDQRRRFKIDPLDYMKAEQFAEESGLQLLGVYHSHPEHPAIPSEHDRKQAMPFFSYIIISVYGGELKDIRSYRLNEEREFEEEEITNIKIPKL